MPLNFDLYQGSESTINSINDTTKHGNIILDDANSMLYIVDSQGKPVIINSKYIEQGVLNNIGSKGLNFTFNETDREYYVAPADASIPCTEKCADKEIIIPAVYTDPYTGITAPVTGIMPDSFKNVSCYSIYIPDTVRFIEPQSFNNTKTIIVRIPLGLETYEYYTKMFEGLTSRYIVCEELVLGNIGGISGVLEVVNEKHIIYSDLGTVLTSIAENSYMIHDVYRKNSNINSTLRLGPTTGLTRVDDYVFKDRKELTTVHLASSVTEIGESAFEGCSNISTVNLQDMSLHSLKLKNIFKNDTANPMLAGGKVICIYDDKSVAFVNSTNGTKSITVVAPIVSGTDLYINTDVQELTAGGSYTNSSPKTIELPRLQLTGNACTSSDQFTIDKLVIKADVLITDISNFENTAFRDRVYGTRYSTGGGYLVGNIYFKKLCLHNVPTVTVVPSNTYHDHSEVDTIIYYNAISYRTTEFTISGVGGYVRQDSPEVKNIYIYPDTSDASDGWSTPGGVHIRPAELYTGWQDDEVQSRTLNLYLKCSDRCLNLTGGTWERVASGQYTFKETTYGTINVFVDPEMEELEECRLI